MAQPQGVDKYALQFVRTIDKLSNEEWGLLPRTVQDWSNVIAKAYLAQHEPPTIDQLQEALIDATAHLAGAASAYKEYAGNAERAGRRDALYTTRLSDFEKATERASAVCRRIRRAP